MPIAFFFQHVVGTHWLCFLVSILVLSLNRFIITDVVLADEFAVFSLIMAFSDFGSGAISWKV